MLPLLATQILWINLITDSGARAGDGRRPADRRRHGPQAAPADRAGDRRAHVGGRDPDRPGDGRGDAADDRHLPARRADRGHARSRQRPHRRLHRAGLRPAVQLLQRALGDRERVPRTCSSTRGCGARSRCRCCCRWRSSTSASSTSPSARCRWRSTSGCVCVAMASVVLWFSELRKLVSRWQLILRRRRLSAINSSLEGST